MKKTTMMLVSVMLGVTAASAHTVMNELKSATGNPDKAVFVGIPVPEAAEMKIDTSAPAGVQQFLVEHGDGHTQPFFEERHHGGSVDDAEHRAEQHYAHNEGARHEMGRKGGGRHHGKLRSHARRAGGKDENGHNHGKVRRPDRREAGKDGNGNSEVFARKSHGRAD